MKQLIICALVCLWASTASAQDCYLQLSGADLHLVRHNGTTLPINGIPETIPIDGVRLSPGAYWPDTIYNVYAVMAGGTMALEASTTPHVTDPISGLPVMDGDTGRVLVGRAFTGKAGQWVDDSWRIYVLSYYNRREKRGHTWFTQNRGVSTVGLRTQIDQELTQVFITWSDEVVRIDFSGYASNDNGFASITNLLVRSVPMDVSSAFWGNWAAIGDYPVNLHYVGSFSPSRYHDVTVACLNVGPQTTTYGGGSPQEGLMSALFVTVRG